MADTFQQEAELRVRAAYLYHMEGLTQDAVAHALGITRSRVLRMLAAARDDGTVQVRVTAELGHCVELGRRLEKRFGLERAQVIPRPQDEGKVDELIGAATGAALAMLRPNVLITDEDVADGLLDEPRREPD